MRSKNLLIVLSVIVLAAVIFFLTRRNSGYTEEQVASIQSLVAKIEHDYSRLDSTNLPVLQSFLAITEHTGQWDSNIAVLDRAVDARTPLYAPIRQRLDSLEGMTRDTASSLTKGVVEYVKATRQATQLMESQAGHLFILHDRNLTQAAKLPAGAMEIPGTNNVLVPGNGPPPMFQPFTESVRVLKILNESRAKAKATIAEGAH